MWDWTKSFEIEDGLSLNGEVLIGGGSDSPIGVDAPIGSFYFRTDGKVWKKYSVGASGWRLFPYSEETVFVPDGTNFPDTILNAQTAIEYAKQNAEGFPRAGLQLTRNGTVSNNDYITTNELLPDAHPLFPVKTKINELTWINTNTNRSFDLEFYRNADAPANLLYTLEVRNSTLRYGYITDLSMIFEPGELCLIKYKDQGLNCSDFNLTLWISRVV